MTTNPKVKVPIDIDYDAYNQNMTWAMDSFTKKICPISRKIHLLDGLVDNELWPTVQAVLDLEIDMSIGTVPDHPKLGPYLVEINDQ